MFAYRSIHEASNDVNASVAIDPSLTPPLAHPSPPTPLGLAKVPCAWGPQQSILPQVPLYISCNFLTAICKLGHIMYDMRALLLGFCTQEGVHALRFRTAKLTVLLQLSLPLCSGISHEHSCSEASTVCCPWLIQYRSTRYPLPPPVPICPRPPPPGPELPYNLAFRKDTAFLKVNLTNRHHPDKGSTHQHVFGYLGPLSFVFVVLKTELLAAGQNNCGIQRRLATLVAKASGPCHKG